MNYSFASLHKARAHHIIDRRGEFIMKDECHSCLHYARFWYNVSAVQGKKDNQHAEMSCGCWSFSLFHIPQWIYLILLTE